MFIAAEPRHESFNCVSLALFSSLSRGIYIYIYIQRALKTQCALPGRYRGGSHRATACTPHHTDTFCPLYAHTILFGLWRPLIFFIFRLISPQVPDGPRVQQATAAHTTFSHRARGPGRSLYRAAIGETLSLIFWLRDVTRRGPGPTTTFSWSPVSKNRPGSRSTMRAQPP